MPHAKSTLSWDDIEPLIELKYKSFLKEIDPSVFKLVLDENERPQVTASILTMLQTREPENATKEYTKKVVDGSVHKLSPENNFAACSIVLNNV